MSNAMPAIIDNYGREALERLHRQAAGGNREAAEILVKLAANCVWSRPPCDMCGHRAGRADK